MNEQDFQKAKEYIVNNDVAGLNALVQNGLDVDEISVVEPYSTMGYFLIFSQNFEKKEVARFLYTHSRALLDTKNSLLLGLLLHEETLLKKVEKAALQRHYEHPPFSEPSQWAQHVPQDIKALWAKVAATAAPQALSTLELLEIATRIQNVSLIEECGKQEAIHHKHLDHAINVRDDTILHVAAGMGAVEAGERLINLGANLDYANIYRWTPLHFASRYGHIDMVKLLVSKGANTQLTIKDGSTAFDIATKHHYSDIAKALS